MKTKAKMAFKPLEKATPMNSKDTAKLEAKRTNQHPKIKQEKQTKLPMPLSLKRGLALYTVVVLVLCLGTNSAGNLRRRKHTIGGHFVL